MADDPVTQFHLQPLVTRVGPVALVTIDNGADWRKPNTFGPHALASLSEVLERLAEPEWRGLVLTGKPLVFAARTSRASPGSRQSSRARAGSPATSSSGGSASPSRRWRP